MLSSTPAGPLATWLRVPDGRVNLTRVPVAPPRSTALPLASIHQQATTGFTRGFTSFFRPWPTGSDACQFGCEDGPYPERLDERQSENGRSIQDHRQIAFGPAAVPVRKTMFSKCRFHQLRHQTASTTEAARPPLLLLVSVPAPLRGPE